MADKIADGAALNHPDGKRWYLTAEHPTGVPMDPMQCRWFATRAQAREELRERARRAS